MKRITKIAVLAAFAVLATATAASASVAVDADGNGLVGKGDVQSALGFNDAALQNAWKAGQIKFTVNAEKVAADYEMSCYGSNATMHRQIIHFGTATIEATALLNPQGKVSQGWNLTGKTTGFTFSSGTYRDSACPEGSFPFMNVGVPTQPNTMSITGGLKVNGIDLPNTPVPAAV
jgi:hypothetical protein